MFNAAFQERSNLQVMHLERYCEVSHLTLGFSFGPAALARFKGKGLKLKTQDRRQHHGQVNEAALEKIIDVIQSGRHIRG